MKRLLIVLALLSACSQNGSVSQEPSIKNVNTGETIVTVNGMELKQGYLDMLATINPRIKAQLDNSATRKQFLENLAEQELLYQEASKRKLDDKDEVIQKAAVYKKIIISQALLEDELAKKSKIYYDENKDAEFTKKQISLIQINLTDDADEPKGKDAKKPEAKDATEEQKKKALNTAKSIAERLKKGEDFASIAQEVSDDKATKKKGGAFGSVSSNDKRLARRDLQAVGEAAFKLKNGDVSDPILTKKAYYIVKVTSDIEVTPYEEAEKVLRFQLQKEVKEELVTTLKKQADIKYNEINLIPTETPEAPTSPTATEPAAAGAEAIKAPAPQFELPKKNDIHFKPVLKTEDAAPKDDHKH